MDNSQLQFNEGDLLRWINGVGIECTGSVSKNDDGDLIVIVDRAEFALPISLFYSNETVTKVNP